MPKIGSIFKTSIIIILIVFILIFAVYLRFKISEDNLISLIGVGIVGAFGMFTSVFQIKGKKDTEDMKEDIAILKDNDTFLNTKISGFNARFLNLEDQNSAYEDALRDIKTGLAEKEEAEYYVYMHVKHKNEINNLCKDIKAETFSILEDQSELDIRIKKFVVEINTNISNIITLQYETGFERFEPNYYKTEVLNSIDLSLNNSDFKETFKSRLKKELKKSTDNYISSITLILANKENGERRGDFIERTLSYTKNLTSKTLNTHYKKSVA